MASPPGNEGETDEYPFSPGKGTAVIIIDKGLGQASPREGSHRDKEMLCQMFSQLGFKPNVIQDLGSKELLEELQRISSQDFSNTDCLAVAISSHGDEVQTEQGVRDDIIGTWDGNIRTRIIVDMFTDERCPSLKGKPRLFFVQACRGKRLDSGQEVVIHDEKVSPVPSKSGEVTSDDHPYGTIVKPAPCHTDFLIMYSTPPGFYAFRSPDKGSIFVRLLCEVLLKTDGPLSFMKRLTRVIGEVAREATYTPSTPQRDKKKLTPVINSMLTRDLCLLPLGSSS